MSPKQSTLAIIAGAFILVAALVIGIVVGIPRQAEKVVSAGSVTIETTADDQGYLERLNQAQGAQAPDPAYGGSSIQQSPQLDVDAWMHLLHGEFK